MGVRLRVYCLGSVSAGVTQPPLFLQSSYFAGSLKFQVCIYNLDAQVKNRNEN